MNLAQQIKAVSALFARKPAVWLDVPVVESTHLESCGMNLDAIKTFQVQDVYGVASLLCVPDGPCAMFSQSFSHTDVFLLDANVLGLFLVNPSGYRYGRHWLRVARGPNGAAAEAALYHMIFELRGVLRAYLVLNSGTELARVKRQVLVQETGKNVLRIEMTDGQRFDIEIRPGSGEVS